MNDRFNGFRGIEETNISCYLSNRLSLACQGFLVMDYLFEASQGIILGIRVLTHGDESCIFARNPMDEGLFGSCICHVSRQVPQASICSRIAS